MLLLLLLLRRRQRLPLPYSLHLWLAAAVGPSPPAVTELAAKPRLSEARLAKLWWAFPNQKKAWGFVGGVFDTVFLAHHSKPEVVIGIFMAVFLIVTTHFLTSAAVLVIILLLMIQILHYLKDPKLWELWYTPDYG